MYPVKIWDGDWPPTQVQKSKNIWGGGRPLRTPSRTAYAFTVLQYSYRERVPTKYPNNKIIRATNKAN